MKSFISIAILIAMALTSCEKNDVVELPKPQKVSFNVYYSGTAVSNRSSVLYLKILKDGFTHERMEESVMTYYLNDGVIMTSDFELEPGTYTVKGYLDWDDSRTQNDYEQAILEKTFTITGEDVQIFEITLKDNTSPNAWGWISGSVRYSPQNSSHKILAEVHKGYPVVLDHSFVISSGIDFSGGTFAIFNSNMLEPGENYYIVIWWDENDNGEYDTEETGTIRSNLYVNPGLPEPVNVVFQ